MNKPRVEVHPMFYVITGESVADVVATASDLDESNLIRSIEIVKEDDGIFTMVCLRTRPDL